MIQEFKGETLCQHCKTCMEDIYLNSHSKALATEIMRIKEKIPIKELHALFKKHLIVEHDAQQKYLSMAEMTDDGEARNTFMKLSEKEREHHELAQKMIDTLEKTFSKTLT